VRQGIRFLEQARSGPAGVAYLPYYYAILQFAKAYVVARGRSVALHRSLRHGVSYDPDAKESRSLLSETINVHLEGVFPVYYEALTGHSVPDPRPIKKRRDKRSPIMQVEMGGIYRLHP
jgi:hypothetical protein